MDGWMDEYFCSRSHSHSLTLYSLPLALWVRYYFVIWQCAFVCEYSSDDFTVFFLLLLSLLLCLLAMSAVRVCICIIIISYKGGICTTPNIPRAHCTVVAYVVCVSHTTVRCSSSYSASAWLLYKRPIKYVRMRLRPSVTCDARFVLFIVVELQLQLIIVNFYMI